MADSKNIANLVPKHVKTNPIGPDNKAPQDTGKYQIPDSTPVSYK